MAFLVVDDENYDSAIQSGAKAFFTKPIYFSSLRQEFMQIHYLE
ncbi:MAG: hypothetical protein WD431_06945 [Cyclobacteriaceae bacterium]